MDPITLLGFFQLLLPVATRALSEGRNITQEELDNALQSWDGELAGLESVIRSKS